MCTKFFYGRPVEKTPLRRSRRRWEGNTKVYLKVIQWEGRQAFVNMVMNLRVT
jgi:hypothetical protein